MGSQVRIRSPVLLLWRECVSLSYGYLGKTNQINTLALPSWLAKDVE